MNIESSILGETLMLTKPLKIYIALIHIYIFSSLPKGACLKTYAKAKISEVETEISEALKHAPKRKGGSRYKVSSEFHSLCFDIPSTS